MELDPKFLKFLKMIQIGIIVVSLFAGILNYLYEGKVEILEISGFYLFISTMQFLRQPKVKDWIGRKIDDWLEVIKENRFNKFFWEMFWKVVAKIIIWICMGLGVGAVILFYCGYIYIFSKIFDAIFPLLRIKL